MSIFLILFYVLLAIFCFVKLTLRPHNFPPGPRGMPLLGYAPFFPINQPFFCTLHQMAKKYGPVLGFYLGPFQPLISVDGEKAAKEALLNNDLNGRPSGTVVTARTLGEKLGLVMVDGDFWQEQRRFTLRHLRDLGFGKTSIEDQMMNEIGELISEITEAAQSDPDHVVDFKAIFTVSVFNLLWVIIGGKRFQRDDLESKKLLNDVAQILQGENVARAIVPVPAFLARLFPSLPGPRGMPLLGYAPFFPINQPFFCTLHQMAKKYGPVLGFYLGPFQPLISVDGEKAAKEALLNNDLNGRPSGTVVTARTLGEKLGLVMVDGDFWQEQRRFTLRHLRDLGFGKTSIEDQMMNEIGELISEITEAAQSDPDHVVDFKAIFTVSVFNLLWVIIGGKRFQRDDLESKKLLNDVAQILQGENVARAIVPVPAFLARLFPSLPGKLGINGDLCLPVQQFIEKSIDEHVATRSKGDAPRDFIDAYLDEMEEPSAKNSTFTKKQLIVSVQDLFTAGSDTSSATIGFAVLYMIHYSAIQQKMRDELKNVCGDSLPSLAHRAILPFTDAFVMEVLRMANVVSLGVPHFAMNDTQLLGFNIPKGSIVVININSVLQDAEMWHDPENFRPERHLGTDGKLVKNEAFTPFGMGKRACMGESLARKTVFLFIAALAKSFEFKSLPNKPLPTLDPVIGFFSAPQPFKAVVAPLVP